MNKVFLGGTCNESTWRQELIELLEVDFFNPVVEDWTPEGVNESTWRQELTELLELLEVDFFNPVVEDWTPECVEEENKEKYERCDILLFVITSKMTGVYSIAEMVESCFLEDKMTVYNIIPDGFDEGQLRSLKAVEGILKRNGALGFIGNDMKRLANILNN